MARIRSLAICLTLILHRNVLAENHQFSNLAPAPAVVACIVDADCPARQTCCKFGCGSCTVTSDEILACPSLNAGPGVPGGHCADLCTSNAQCTAGERCCSERCVRKCHLAGAHCSAHAQCPDGQRCCKNACGQSCQKCYPGTHFPCPLTSTMKTPHKTTMRTTVYSSTSRGWNGPTWPRPTSSGAGLQTAWLVLIVSGSLVVVVCIVSVTVVLVRRSCRAKIECGSDRMMNQNRINTHASAPINAPPPYIGWSDEPINAQPPAYYQPINVDEPPPYYSIMTTSGSGPSTVSSRTDFNYHGNNSTNFENVHYAQTNRIFSVHK